MEGTFYTKADKNGYRNRVRAYAKRNGKQIISPWSAVKKLKMKK